MMLSNVNMIEMRFRAKTDINLQMWRSMSFQSTDTHVLLRISIDMHAVLSTFNYMYIDLA